MIVYIPIGLGQTVLPQTYKCLCDQPMVDDIVTVFEKESYPREDLRRYQAIGKARKRCIDLAKHDPYDYMFFSNSDLIHNGNTVEDAFNFMETHKKFGAVSYYLGIDTNPLRSLEPGYVQVGCFMVRSSALNDINFDVKDGDTCDGIAFAEEIRKAGWRWGYMSREGGRVMKHLVLKKFNKKYDFSEALSL